MVRNIGIRSRGTGSRSGVKPGLRVDFDRYTADQKFLGLKSFVLRNNTQDASNMRERISMLMFRRLGLPAPREAYAKLYVKDVYAGLYTIVESVDRNYALRNYGEDDGYLYKYDYPSEAQRYYFEDWGTDAGRYVPLPFKPETHENDPRPEYVVQLVQTINDRWNNFRSAIAEWLDLQKFIRHVALEVFLSDYDGFLGDWGMNNYYLYRYNNQKRFVFIPWDKSQALSSPTYSIWHNITEVPSFRSNRLFARAMESRDLYDYYLDTLMEALKSATEPGGTDPRGWMEREIDREDAQIKEAVYADPQKDYTNDQYDGEVSKLREWAQQRGASVAAEVAAARAQ